MAEEHPFNTMTPEDTELEIGHMAENSHLPYTHSSDDTMDRVRTEFVIGDRDYSNRLIEETTYHIEEEDGDLSKVSDIPDGMIEKASLPEETDVIEVLEEEGGHLRLNSDILEVITGMSLPEQTPGPVGGCSRMICDILECMTITSSPAEQTIDLLEDFSGDLGSNDMFPPEENYSEDVHMIRTPTSVTIGANHKFAVCSRYLSAPSFSCHDTCKSGHKHHLEDPKRRISGTLKGARPLMRTTGDAISTSKADTKRKALLRRSSLQGPIIQKDPPTDIETMNHCKKDLNRLKLKRIQGEIKPPSAPASGHSSCRRKSDILGGKKMVAQSPKLLDNSKTVEEINTMKERGSLRRVTKEKAKEPTNKPVSPKMPLNHKKSPSTNTRSFKTLQSSSRSRNQSSSEQAKTKKSVNVPEKTLHMIEPSTDKKSAKRPLKVASSSKSLQNTLKAKEKISNPSSPGIPVTLKSSPSVKAGLHKNIKSFSRSKNQNNPGKAKISGAIDVPEKTLYMIEPNSDRKPSRRASITASSKKRLYMIEPKSDKNPLRRASISTSSSKKLPNSPRTSRVSENKGSEDNQKGIEFDHLSPLSTSLSISVVSIEEPNENQEENHKDSDSMDIEQISTTADGEPGPSTPGAKSALNDDAENKRTDTCHPEEEEDASGMLKFRRGAEVSLQVADTSSKKLQFRRGRILDNDQNAEDEAVCLKKTELTDDEPCGSKPEAQKFLLKHKEAAGRKDNVDLNNVIEETASKLVKTRKSKVKALVGAFETVISLHDRKPLFETRVV